MEEIKFEISNEELFNKLICKLRNKYEKYKKRIKQFNLHIRF